MFPSTFLLLRGFPRVVLLLRRFPSANIRYPSWTFYTGDDFWGPIHLMMISKDRFSPTVVLDFVLNSEIPQGVKALGIKWKTWWKLCIVWQGAWFCGATSGSVTRACCARQIGYDAGCASRCTPPYWMYDSRPSRRYVARPAQTPTPARPTPSSTCNPTKSPKRTRASLTLPSHTPCSL